MTPIPVRERLQALPPDLPDLPGRFERVRDRVRRRRRRRVAVASASTALVVLATPVVMHLASTAGNDRGTGPTDHIAPAPSVEPIPGADRVTALTDTQVHDGSGTETVQLGARPAGATSITLEVTCLTAGRIRWPDGSSSSCSASSVGNTAHSVLDLDPAQDEIVMTANASVDWQVRTTYVHVEATDWGTNANGDTFGVSNDRGDPDLIAAAATNGRIGYVYNDELDHVTGGDVSTPEEALEWQETHGDEQATIPVYESDGETVIGEFETGSSVGSSRPGPDHG